MEMDLLVTSGDILEAKVDLSVGFIKFYREILKMKKKIFVVEINPKYF